MDLEQLKILIAEDGEADRLILDKIIRAQGHQTVLAKNGREAIELFQKERPSIVLMDALMPEVDGFEAATKIRALAGENFIPILFLTSLNDDRSLISSLEAGGDDFISKPYKPLVLAAKIQAYRRMLMMHRSVQTQRDKIARSNEQLLAEQLIAQKVYDNVVHLGCLDELNIKHKLSPMSVFNGDILIAARKPSGGLLVFLGNFTGHGLPAAIGAMPIAEIFYGMAAKGFSIENIVSELNEKLRAILPAGFVCGASMLEVNYSRQRIKIWNGGSPDVLLKRGTGSVQRFKSVHPPLGGLPAEQFSTDCVQCEMLLNDRVYLFSDGLLKLQNDHGQLFGMERVCAVLLAATNAELAFEHLLDATVAFMGHKFIGNTFMDSRFMDNQFIDNNSHEDNLTLAEVVMVADDGLPGSTLDVGTSSAPGARDWAFSFELRNQTVCDFNPIPLMLHVTMEVPELKAYSHDLYTIFAELISNAIDHGLLGLNSDMKQSAAGFHKYYEARAEKLKHLVEPSIQISIRHQPEAEGGLLTIEVKDSGAGFDIQNIDGVIPGRNKLSGRGIPLLKSLCETVDYLGNGNTARVRYRWSSRDNSVEGQTSQSRDKPESRKFN